MLRPVCSEAPPQLVSVHSDINRGTLLEQRVVSRILEHGCKTTIVVDRAGGGNGTGVGCASDRIAAQRAAVQRPALDGETVVDIDILDAAGVLLVEFRSGHGRSRQRT